jgi:mono/diheme cytochrome c family protein
MFKGDDVPKNAGGAVLCWKRFLGMETPLTDEQISLLNAYYEFAGKGMEVKEFKFTTIALPKKDKAKLKEDQNKIAGMQGDKVKGEKLFEDACKFCHQKNSTVKDVTNIFKNFDGDLNSIVFQIRIGSKHMQFYPYELISDQDIADLSSFILGKK